MMHNVKRLLGHLTTLQTKNEHMDMQCGKN